MEGDHSLHGTVPLAIPATQLQVGDPELRLKLHTLWQLSLISNITMTAGRNNIIAIISLDMFFKGRKGIAFPRTKGVVILHGAAEDKQQRCHRAHSSLGRCFPISHSRLQHASSVHQRTYAGIGFKDSLFGNKGFIAKT